VGVKHENDKDPENYRKAMVINRTDTWKTSEHKWWATTDVCRHI